MEEIVSEAREAAGQLEMGKAFRNVALFPLFAIGYVIGLIVWLIRFLWGIFVVGVKRGMAPKG